MQPASIVERWLELPAKGFQRSAQLSDHTIACDCAGFVNLLLDELSIGKPWCLTKPKAVHYYGLLQEIGSNRIADIKPGNLLAWRKDRIPQKGDTGHVLWVAGSAQAVSENCFQLPVVDASKRMGGLAKRTIELYCADKKIIGVRLHLDDSKIKRTAIYHHPLANSRYCFGCSLPKRVCNCGALEPNLNNPGIIIFRDPKERKRTLSTVSLIKQRYPAVLVKDGELFDARGYHNAALLYPKQDEGQATQTGSHSDISSEIKAGKEYTIVLIDGTWRKAKKILHLNPWLLQLPRISLAPGQVSDYLLRRVANHQALSSVEAFACAMEDQVLFESLRPFMERQIELMGRDIYRKNYADHINFSLKG